MSALRAALVAMVVTLASPMAGPLAQGTPGFASPQRAYVTQPVRPNRSLYVAPGPRWPSPYARPEVDGSFEGDGAGTTFRTLCVRLCDGFYFPISFATDSGGLTRDAERCSASCGAEARLFFHPNPGGSTETMVDFAGFAYSALPNAFKYRKALTEGCQCRPQPWSQPEQQRHRGYSEAEPGAKPPSAAASAAGAAPCEGGEVTRPIAIDRDALEAERALTAPPAGSRRPRY